MEQSLNINVRRNVSAGGIITGEKENMSAQVLSSCTIYPHEQMKSPSPRAHTLLGSQTLCSQLTRLPALVPRSVPSPPDGQIDAKLALEAADLPPLSSGERSILILSNKSNQSRSRQAGGQLNIYINKTNWSYNPLSTSFNY